MNNMIMITGGGSVYLVPDVDFFYSTEVRKLTYLLNAFI